ncbi:glycoside hydrolase family 2 TIM barrel-domain containing protein [Pseudactinotalea suaedae]|uniref:glycoside hydrolase family 2 TIM barrel-domain containing protein n=1 Tax=Pseudactinotalea suaedae TaxID=1524924 RepID=UPI0012E2626E|nr:glycoside hydrolase family 2 TIM barrel-domain containing protein [Pseudactinotalea suaedae]
MRSLDITSWAFLPVDDPDVWRKRVDEQAWRPVTVPHDWSVEQPFAVEHSSGTGYLPAGVAWYRTHVPLTDLGPLEGRSIQLVFHGVYRNAAVWVNGYHLGGRPSGYARFAFDLTEIVSYAPDDDLVVAVRVEHTRLSNSRWYNGAGITRRVELQVREQVHIPEPGTVLTTVAADPEHATVRLEHQITSGLDHPAAVHVHHELRSLTTDSVHGVTSEVEVPAHGTADVDLLVEIAQPQLWSDTEPHLYRLTTTLRWPQNGDQVGSTDQTVLGIRTFAFDPDDGFSINGRPRLLQGVCLHEDAGCLGTAVPAEVWLRRLLSLKRMGCNAVRMAHNPHAPELYQLCDLLGLFVIDEAFDEWENPKNKWWQGHNVYPPRHQGDAADFPQWYEQDLTAMVDAHRHHPSIIAWSIGNEIDYPNDPYASPLFDEMTGNNDANKPAAERVYDPDRPDMRRLTGIAERLAGIVRRLDPSRPVTLAAAFPEVSSRTGLLETVDLVGYNYKEHLYAADHDRFPHKPFVGSENSHRYDAWRYVLDNDYVAGQFLWTGIDYLGEAHGWPIHGSGAGVLTLAGFEKHTWHLRRSWWSEEPVAYLVTRPPGAGEERRPFWTHPVSRTWDASAGPLLEVLCFANGDDLTLTCAGEQVELRRDEEIGCWSAEVAPQDAPLVLSVLQDGVVVARDELVPRGPVTSMEATRWRPPADIVDAAGAVGLGLDGVAQIECVLRDEHGRPARGEVVVTARVEAGELLGLENGDLGDNTPYSSESRSTLDGRIAVFVRCSERTIVTLSAPGLAPVSLACAP